METAGRPRSGPALWQYLAETHFYPSPTGEEVAYCVIKSHSASPEKPYMGIMDTTSQHGYMNLKVDSCGTPMRPLRPEASLAGTFTHLSMTVFIGRSVKDRPAAPSLRKKPKTEHLTTFFALSRQGWHTHTVFGVSCPCNCWFNPCPPFRSPRLRGTTFGPGAQGPQRGAETSDDSLEGTPVHLGKPRAHWGVPTLPEIPSGKHTKSHGKWPIYRWFTC